jgi:formate dehydrogenase subunit gamma
MAAAGGDDNPSDALPPVVLGTPPVAGRSLAGERVRRFNGVEIATHWTFAGLFLLLLASGLALFHPQWRNLDLAGVKLVKEIHIALGLLFVLAPLTVAAWDNWRALRADARALRTWTAADTGWLVALAARAACQRRAAPDQKRFNAGQKLNVAYVMVISVGLVVTGGLIWPDWLLPPGERALLFQMHDLLMLLSVPAVVIHVVLATVVPATRPSLRGMVDGTVPAAWHQAHYPRDPGPAE